MSPKKMPAPVNGPDARIEELRRERERRAKTYRERALKLFPMCAPGVPASLKGNA